MSTSMPEKDSGAVLDYTWDFRAFTNDGGSNVALSDWLEEGETITDYTLTVSAVTTGCLPVVVDNYLASGSTCVVAWLSGGASYKEFLVNCAIVTSSSPVARKDERTIKIKIMDR